MTREQAEAEVRQARRRVSEEGVTCVGCLAIANQPWTPFNYRMAKRAREELVKKHGNFYKIKLREELSCVTAIEFFANEKTIPTINELMGIR